MDSGEKKHSLEECVQEYIVYLEGVKSLAEKTVRAYKDDLNHLMLCLGRDKDITSVSPEDIRRCMTSLSSRKYSVASVNRFLSGVRGLFYYCRKMDYISFNFAGQIHQLKKAVRLPKFMSQDEIDSLCYQARSGKFLWSQRDTAIFEMFYSSGCRVSELVSLTFKDFSEDLGSAMIMGKGGKSRRVFFSQDAVKSLKKYLVSRRKRFPSKWLGGGEYVDRIFLNQKGGALSVKGVWFIVNLYSGERGLKRHITPHSFRHTFATQLMNNGADIRKVQTMLGHASISTTQCYTHVTADRLKEIYEQAFPHT
ncbi:tyrosine-type recombinase/integrase [Treponema sp.]|uniref:tyrosine-type recombinase/integrase n=1 Tax=Treponema sp. TaxID=166 RepID=UPI0025E4FB99|nr:tyrosine-type recombinase/integrase [Treponema sp.]MCR5217195.1 tyrosine-type recombinase/integrase [Treponema sp.]